jgi:hypothetical protein
LVVEEIWAEWVIFEKKIMETIVVTPRSKKSGLFLKKLLLQLNDVKNIEVVPDPNELPFAVLTESSLEKEWNSNEDSIWDAWAEEKLKTQQP